MSHLVVQVRHETSRGYLPYREAISFYDRNALLSSNPHVGLVKFSCGLQATRFEIDLTLSKHRHVVLKNCKKMCERDEYLYRCLYVFHLPQIISTALG